MTKFPDQARGSDSGRPIMVVFDVLGKKWSLRILWELQEQQLTFRDLQSRCEQVSPTLLNNRLKELRSLGLVERQEQGYGLTDMGLSLKPHLIGLDNWANQWQQTFTHN